MNKDPSILRIVPRQTSEKIIRDRVDGYVDGYRSVIALKEALNIGLFDILKRWTHLDDLASVTGLDRNLLGHLCESLVFMGFLSRRGLEFRDRKCARDFLTKDSGMTQVNSLRYRIDSLSQLDMLDSALHHDRGELKSDMFTDAWISMIGEGAIGGPIGMTLECIESFLDLSKYDSWIDLGGGHGLYSIAMAHSHPNIRCTVFDQPSITPSTKRFSEEYGVDIDIQTGDFYVDEIKGTFDIVFSSYNRSCSDPVLIPKIMGALRPGGYYIIRRPKDNKYWNPMFSFQRAIVSDFEFNPDAFEDTDFLKELDDAGLKMEHKAVVGGSEVLFYARR